LFRQPGQVVVKHNLFFAPSGQTPRFIQFFYPQFFLGAKRICHLLIVGTKRFCKVQSGFLGDKGSETFA
jgi:hypothetical protein